MNHFTDKGGFDAIRSQPTWIFKVEQPRAAHHPVGAYFTDYDVKEPNLSKKIFVPRTKLAYFFGFNPPLPLEVLPGGRGRLGHIFFARADYAVERTHQLGSGATELA